MSGHVIRINVDISACKVVGLRDKTRLDHRGGISAALLENSGIFFNLGAAKRIEEADDARKGNEDSRDGSIDELESRQHGGRLIERVFSRCVSRRDVSGTTKRIGRARESDGQTDFLEQNEERIKDSLAAYTILHFVRVDDIRNHGPGDEESDGGTEGTDGTDDVDYPQRSILVHPIRSNGRHEPEGESNDEGKALTDLSRYKRPEEETGCGHQLDEKQNPCELRFSAQNILIEEIQVVLEQLNGGPAQEVEGSQESEGLVKQGRENAFPKQAHLLQEVEQAGPVISLLLLHERLLSDDEKDNKRRDEVQDSLAERRKHVTHAIIDGERRALVAEELDHVRVRK